MRPFPASLVVLLAASGLAAASQPSGIYARVTKVELLPAGATPETATEVKVHGEFIMVEVDGKRSDVRAGFLHFGLAEKKAAVCRAEWADLAAVAKETDEVPGDDPGPGKGRYVALGSAYGVPNHAFSISHVHPAAAAGTTATPYPTNAGLVRLRASGHLDDSRSPVLDFQKYRAKKSGRP